MEGNAGLGTQRQEEPCSNIPENLSVYFILTEFGDMSLYAHRDYLPQSHGNCITNVLCHC